MTKSNPKSIREALETLNDAAKDQKSDLKNMVKEDFGHLETLFDTLKAEGKRKGATYLREAEAKMEEAQNKVHDMSSSVDSSVREDPWKALGITAGVALLLGLLLGRGK